MPEATTSKRRCNLDATKFGEASAENLTMDSAGEYVMPNVETVLEDPGPVVVAEKAVDDSKALAIFTENSYSPRQKLQPLVTKVSTRSNKGGARTTTKPARKKRSREEINKVEVTTARIHRCTLMECEENSSSIVGFGRLQEDQKTFHGCEVPAHCSVVMVTLIAKARYPLPFPSRNDDPPQEVISDACQSTILWPTEYIVMDNR